MSGWDAWAEQLVKRKACFHGAIIARDGSSTWGKCGDFSLTEYWRMVDNGEGGEKRVWVDEGQMIVDSINAQGYPTVEMLN